MQPRTCYFGLSLHLVLWLCSASSEQDCDTCSQGRAEAPQLSSAQGFGPTGAGDAPVSRLQCQFWHTGSVISLHGVGISGPVALKRVAASSQPLDIFVNIFTVKFRKFPRVRSDAEGRLVAAACAGRSFSAGSPELFSCYQGSQISPRPQILILFFNQSPARTSYKDAVSSGWPGSAWSLARQELLPGGEGSAAGWRIAR